MRVAWKEFPKAGPKAATWAAGRAARTAYQLVDSRAAGSVERSVGLMAVLKAYQKAGTRADAKAD